MDAIIKLEIRTYIELSQMSVHKDGKDKLLSAGTNLKGGKVRTVFFLRWVTFEYSTVLIR